LGPLAVSYVFVLAVIGPLAARFADVLFSSMPLVEASRRKER
jgi:hypothetical protein